MQSEEIRKQVDQMVEEAITIRFDASEHIPSTTTTPQDMYVRLLGLRSALDRLDEIVVNIIKARAMTKIRAMTDNFAAEAEFDKQLDRIRKAPSSKTEYTGAKERLSEANLASFEARRAALEAQKLATHLEAAAEIVRKLHRDLDSARLDIHAIIKTFAFESNIDR